MTSLEMSESPSFANRLVERVDRLAESGWQAYAVVGAVHLACALLAYDPTPQTGGDNAAYRALAEALASGRGYVRLWEPGTPKEILYPPMFPLAIAAAMSAGARSFAALQLFAIMISTATVSAMFLWLRRAVNARAALGCGMIIALSPGLISGSHALLSDVLFAGLSALTLALFTSLDASEPSAVRQRLMLAVGAATATVLSYFTRSAGLPMLVGAFGWLLWRRLHAGTAVLVAMSAPLAIAWSIRGRGPGATNYTDYLRFVDPYQPDLGRVDGAGLLGRVVANLWTYTTVHLPTLLFGTAEGFAALGGLSLVVLALIGYIVRLRRPTVAEFWTPLYLAVLVLWPEVWSGDRLLLPLYPLLLAYVVAAYAMLRDRLSPRLVVLALGASVLTLLVNDAGLMARGVRCTATYRAGVTDPCVEGQWSDYFRVARSMREKLPAGSVLLSRKPTIVYALSGYKSLAFPLSRAPDTLFSEAQKVGASYLVVDASQLTSMYVYPILRERPDRFCMMASLSRDRALLLRIGPGRPGGPSAADTTIENCAPR